MTKPQGPTALIGTAPTGIGFVRVHSVPNPFPGGTPWVVAYAAVLPKSPTYAGHPVAMVVTVKSVSLWRAAGHDEEPPTHWEPWSDQIGDLYADPAMRRRATGHPVAVEVGKWMLNLGLFASHSPSRTPAGQAWAEQVGGCIPPLKDDGSDADVLSRNGAAALNRLRTDWGPWWESPDRS